MHDVEDLISQFIGHVANDVSRIIRRHFLQNFGNRFLVELLEELGADDVIELRQNIGALLRILDQVEKNPLLLEFEVAKQMGDVGRVRLGKQFRQVGIGPPPDQSPGGIEQ